MLNSIIFFLQDEEGTALMEYALIGAVVSVAGLASLASIGSAVSLMFSDLSAPLSVLS